MYAYFYAFLCDFVRTSFLWVSGGEPIIITERGNTKHLFSKKEGEWEGMGGGGDIVNHFYIFKKNLSMLDLNKCSKEH